MMYTVYLSGLKKTWPVSEVVLVSAVCRVCMLLVFIIHLQRLLISLIAYRKSASCTHIFALLHALAAMTPVPFPIAPRLPDDEDSECVPVTSLPCQWKQPRKRKESNLKMSDATFQKHVYGRTKEIKLLPIEDYNPVQKSTETRLILI